MQAAMLQAQKAYQANEIPIGAIIVHNQHIIAHAHNKVQQNQDPTAHAELLALRIATQQLQTKYLNECTLYITLEPCPMCAQATYWTQLGKLIFATKDPKKGYTLWQQPILHPKTKVTQGILAYQSSLLLKKFFKQLRTKYP